MGETMVISSDGLGEISDEEDFIPHRESLDRLGILMAQLRRLRSVMEEKEGTEGTRLTWETPVRRKVRMPNAKTAITQHPTLGTR